MMISTASSIGTFDSRNLIAMEVVIVASTFALTPLPSPSESATRWRFSFSTVMNLTSSPHAPCPVFVYWAASISMQRSLAAA